MSGDRIDRRRFLRGSAALGGALFLAGCGAEQGISTLSGTTAPAAGSTTADAATTAAGPLYPGTIGDESGKLTIAEWAGYEAGGTKAQTFGLVAGKTYVDRFGADDLRYADYGNDDKNLNTMKAGQRFDLLHPCVDYVQDYVDAGLVQPFDTSLLPSFANLHPELASRGVVDGKQYWIPWDWGFGSILYRKDKVDAADATGWELLFNEKYKGRISMWDGGSLPVMVAGLVTSPPAADVFNQTPEELERSKQALIVQKPLNKFYWTSEYGDQQPAFKAGDIWITYAWPNDYQALGAELGFDKVGYLSPSQGKMAWVCGFMLGKDTESPLHAHEYVESYIAHDAAVNLINLYAYGASDSTIQPAEIEDARIARELGLGTTAALAPPVLVQQHIPNRDAYQRVWAEVKAS